MYVVLFFSIRLTKATRYFSSSFSSSPLPPFSFFFSSLPPLSLSLLLAFLFPFPFLFFSPFFPPFPPFFFPSSPLPFFPLFLPPFSSPPSPLLSLFFSDSFREFYSISLNDVPCRSSIARVRFHKIICNLISGVGEQHAQGRQNLI